MGVDEAAVLATEVAELAADIGRDAGGGAPWQRVGELAVAHVGGCTWASITDARDDRARSLGASDPVASLVDHLQHDLGEGPSVQAAESGTAVLCTDLALERRWPAFVPRAREETPVRCVLALPLPSRDAAAMNFYADRVGAFDDTEVAAASIVAAHAAGLLIVGDATARSTNLEIALRSNRQIGMAIGVLMAGHKLTEQDAFALLRLASQVLHRKLRDIALEIIDTGTLPELPAARARSIARTSGAPETAAQLQRQ